MKSFFSSLLGATLFVILLFFPGLVFEGAKMGLNLWFFTLVPTLLPFMVFSNILIQSRLIEHLLFLPGLFTRKYLHLSPAGLYAFLCGFFFGYPSGAKILADLLKTDQIDPKEASMLFGFCNNVSPAFLITYFLTLHLKHPEKAGDHRLFSVHNTRFCLSDGIFLFAAVPFLSVKKRHRVPCFLLHCLMPASKMPSQSC